MERMIYICVCVGIKLEILKWKDLTYKKLKHLHWDVFIWLLQRGLHLFHLLNEDICIWTFLREKILLLWISYFSTISFWVFIFRPAFIGSNKFTTHPTLLELHWSNSLYFQSLFTVELSGKFTKHPHIHSWIGTNPIFILNIIHYWILSL